MDIFNLFTLVAATFTGASMGSFLLVTLLYVPLLKTPDNLINNLTIYRRLYRLNTVLCLLAGVCAALIKNQSAAVLLTILAASYVFNHAHILKGILKACNEHYCIVNPSVYRSLSGLQNVLHFCQFAGAGYVIYLLALAPPAIN
ncbi:hypothetical protein MNBD_GAMMA08-1036 [hydrothermal vent metagenome]|uniref:DUF4149 domain-containing protein n=1 Tax=hydrothermal vent metagenome TaxID=652676 RepID=A0A3B0XS29_9ZZZZ